MRKILGKIRDKLVYRFQQVLVDSANRNGENVPWLIADIKEILQHTIGRHRACRREVCPLAGQDLPITRSFEELEQSDLYPAINNLLDDLSRKACRLRLNLNTNRAESCFAVFNKYNMGKRIDLASRGELYRRSLAMAATWNDDRWMLKWFRRISDASPGHNNS